MRHETRRATENVATAPKFMNAAEVAERLDVSRSTVYNLIASGRLAAHCMGGGKIRPRGLRVPESAVTAYLAGSTITPKAVA
ncbi:helix-turn-helix domain-containing protein [Streptomyces niveus]|uniref:helix-turn-helix domain-containing protein n=1 Tax=Streptomyces niveus TaxID=193462 RepID=UPI00386414A7|nr:helix-turn-helix domain-containing protein [Streptomyces niveus]